MTPTLSTSPTHEVLTVEVDELPARYNRSLRARLGPTHRLTDSGITVSALCRGGHWARSQTRACGHRPTR